MQYIGSKENCIPHMFDDSDKILEQNLSFLVGDDGSSDVAEYVRAASLDGIQVTTGAMWNGVKGRHLTVQQTNSLLLIEEVLDDFILSFGVIEVDKETPMDQPCSVL